jgi:prepilin-type N-terminal cleavage/methylation domain-containing protein
MTSATVRSLGFTLPEMLTTLAVAGIAVSLAVPGPRQVFADQREADAVSGLVGTLQIARSTAITRNEPVTVCPSRDAERCTNTPWELGWIAFVDADGSGQPGTAGTLVAEPGLAPPYTLLTKEFARGLGYQPSGQAVADAGAAATGAFWLCTDDGEVAARLIWINATGKPRLVDHQANDLPDACAG